MTTPRRRRIRAALLGLAAVVVAFELTMQVIAFLIWRSHDGFAVEGSSSAHAVLCIGDSFTFGLGATAGHDYPQELERILTTTIPDAIVRNGGKPGQDSAQVLRRLPHQLDAVTPRVVYVLVGYNDRWSHPPPVRDDELVATRDDDGFPLRCRTFDLLFRITQALFGSDPGKSNSEVDSASVIALLGPWHSGAFAIEFKPGGELTIGDRSSRWSCLNGRLRVELEPGVPIDVDPAIAGDTLRLSGDALGKEPLSFTRGRAATAPADRVREALARGDLPAAQSELEAALRDAPDADELIALRVELAVLRGDRIAVARDLDHLRQRAPGGEARLRALVDALFATGASSEAVELACSFLASHPANSPLWWTLSRHAATDTTGHPRILAALDSALAIQPMGDPWRAGLLRLRAGILRAGSGPHVELLASSLEAALVDGDKSQAVSWMQDLTFTRAEFEAAVARVARDDTARTRCEAWWKDAREGQAAPAAVLRSHLRRMRELCRAHGSDFVVLTYPEDLGELGRAIRSVASDGIPLIDCEADFGLALQTTPHAQLFVPDGHCNDAGYLRIARLVAADARARLR